MTSAPYCYGPTGKLLYIAEELEKEHNLIFVGSKSSVMLAKSCGFKKIVEITDRNNWNASSINLLKRSDLLVSFLDYRSLQIAKKHKIPSIFFDTLNWIRTKAPPFIENANAYIAQKFFQKSSINLKLPCEFVEVGPIIPKYIENSVAKPMNNDNRSMLVNVGGLHSPVMESNADKAYLNLIIQILKTSDLDLHQIALCLPKYLKCMKNNISEKLPGAEILFLNAREFHERLLTTSLLITQPGLEVVIEAMYCEVPIIFLPPHNGTQVFQAEIYRRLDIYLLYLQLGAEKYIKNNKTELEEITPKLQRFNIGKCSDTLIFKKMGHLLSETISKIQCNDDLIQAKCKNNKSKVMNLGQFGRKATAKQINNFLE